LANRFSRACRRSRLRSAREPEVVADNEVGGSGVDAVPALLRQRGERHRFGLVDGGPLSREGEHILHERLHPIERAGDSVDLG